MVGGGGGRRGEVEIFFGREFWGREDPGKKNRCGRGDVHPRNGFNGLILNWCIGGCWFTPALTKDLKYIRVFSLSYEREATKWFARGNSEDVDEIGENLVPTLVM